VSQLIVRNVDPSLVRALKQRAAGNGRSAEAEHREILRQALGLDIAAEAFKGLLGSMPDVGSDADFAPERDLPRRIP
jgi:antitoxin FitA